jgi:cytochrome c5
MPSGGFCVIEPRQTRAFAAAAALLAAVACGPSETPAEKAARARGMTPADARLAEIHERSCKSCHAVPEALAPLAGDTAAWDARFAQGIDTLVVHARDGFKAMPPRGSCLDCSDDDLRRLTLFMAGRAP